MGNFFMSNFYWFWISVIIICVIIEAFSMSFTTIWAAIASFFMVFISLLEIPLKWQFLIFSSLTLFFILFTRPFAVKKLKNSDVKTNSDSLIGQEVIVTKEILPFSKGEAKTKNGIIWNCVAKSENIISVDSICIITEINGNTLTIKEK